MFLCIVAILHTTRLAGVTVVVTKCVLLIGYIYNSDVVLFAAEGRRVSLCALPGAASSDRKEDQDNDRGRIVH